MGGSWVEEMDLERVGVRAVKVAVRTIQTPARARVVSWVG